MYRTKQFTKKKTKKIHLVHLSPSLKNKTQLKGVKEEVGEDVELVSPLTEALLVLWLTSAALQPSHPGQRGAGGQ